MRTPTAKLHILRRLAEGGFVSGEALGEELGISRAAVSKHIKGIQEWGVDVFRVQGKGYQLSQPMQLLDKSKIVTQLSAPVELISVIDSTNQYLMDRTDSLESGSVCLAEYQSQGRGRRGRQWLSPFGSNLYMSMFWRLEAGMGAAMGLSLVVGIAAVEALEAMGIHGVKLKWPNDLYYQDKKLAGILVEMSGQAGGAANLVIGMGLNIAMEHKDNAIDQPWTSLNQVTLGKRVDRNKLAAAFIDSWGAILEEYEMTGMQTFVPRWNHLDNFLNREVRLLMGNNSVAGIARGIDAQGGVLLEVNGEVKSFIGGEISLRKND